MEKILLILIILCLLKIFNIKIIEKNTDTIAEEKANLEKSGEIINNFYSRKINYTCANPTPENEICLVDQTRQCIIEDYPYCYITPKDEEDAHKYAYKKLCMEKGHCFAEHPDGTYSCEFTKETCKNASKQLKDDDQTLYSDEEKTNGTNKYSEMFWLDGVGCINGGLGISAIKNYCNTEHACNMGEWEFNDENFKCTIKPGYCEKMEMTYRGDKGSGFCGLSTGASISEGLLGKSIARGISNCPPYADLWGGASAEENEKIKEDHCYIHLK